MKKMRLINPHMEPFGAGLKSVMQVCKVKCSFVNRKLNICKRDANVKYLDAFTVALTQKRWYFMNEYSFSQKGGRYAQDRRAVQTDA